MTEREVSSHEDFHSSTIKACVLHQALTEEWRDRRRLESEEGDSEKHVTPVYCWSVGFPASRTLLQPPESKLTAASPLSLQSGLVGALYSCALLPKALVPKVQAHMCSLPLK